MAEQSAGKVTRVESGFDSTDDSLSHHSPVPSEVASSVKTALRASLAVVAGLALVLMIAVELFSAVVHPLPPEFNGSMDEMCQHAARYPDWVLGVVVLAWSAIGLVSAWVAKRIAHRWAGIIVSLILMAALAFNVLMLPYAMWFKVAMLSCFPVECYLGVRRGARTSLPAAGANLA